MAISGADWIAATDPFILALAHAFTGTVGELSNNRIRLQNSEGFISGVADDKDIQEIYWSKDTDREIAWAVNAMETNNPGVHGAELFSEIGKYQERSGSSFISFSPSLYVEDDTKDTLIYTTGKTSGAVKYSLFAYSAFAWFEKDPAQVLFSWIAHHVNSAFTLKDFLNQTNFQDASDYYDENPIILSLWREVGLSISDQVKKVMNHTSDFLTIRPADSDGKLQMHIMPRLSALITRDEEIDLDSKSVKDYIARPTDRYTIDRLNATYGAVFTLKSAGDPDDPGDFNFSRPLDIPGKNRAALSQKVGLDGDGRSVTLDVPYISTRGILSNHIDIGYWKDNQDELEIDFADWSHLNFEVGDLVPVTGGRSNYSSDLFLVTEKRLDLNTMLSSVRAVQLKGLAGKRPRYADQADLVLSITPNSLGDYFDGETAFPKDVFIADDPRNLDRVWDLSNEYAHIAEMTRGAPAANRLQIEEDVRDRWPVLENDGTMGADFPVVLNQFSGVGTSSPTPVAGNLTFYCVLNPDTIAGAGRVIFSQGGGSVFTIFASVAGTVQYLSGGVLRGTKAAITGWQILVFVLDTTGSAIRRNGADLDTGLAFTATKLDPSNDQSLLVNITGDINHFSGQFAEIHAFNGAHSSGTVDLIEAHLAEKYGITI